MPKIQGIGKMWGFLAEAVDGRPETGGVFHGLPDRQDMLPDRIRVDSRFATVTRMAGGQMTGRCEDQQEQQRFR